MNISSVVIMSVVTEAIVTYTKTFVVDKKIKWQIIAAAVFSIVICIAYGLDIPQMAGVSTSIPFVGNVITGILVSRGSNYIYDLLKKFGLYGGKSTDTSNAQDSEVEI